MNLEWLLDNYSDKMDRTGDCWLWTGATAGAGYGIITRDGENYYVHRVVLGVIPDDLEALHSCLNKNCFNPDHLRVGTHAENIQDAVDDGAWDDHPGPPESAVINSGADQTGEAHPAAKFTQDDADRIRREYADKTQAELAEKYGVSRSTISRIVNCELY